VNADAKHKLIRHYAVTDAAVHDSQELDGLLDTGNTKQVEEASANLKQKLVPKLGFDGEVDWRVIADERVKGGLIVEEKEPATRP
jgi:hypothetical protein